jgi:3-oxoacyl-[acyl-carrier protein] reductase
MLLSLDNQLALVTGASRGIGHGIAHLLAKQGAMVIGTATSAEGAKTLSQSFKSNGVKGVAKVMNLRDPDTIEQLISDIKAEFGALSILVNNAAVTKDNLFLRMKEQEWFEVIETNLNAVYRLTKACIRDMLKARFGRIINVGSVVGTTGNGGQANYAASKAALIGLSKSIAQEVSSRNITVNVVSPGFIDTDMTRALTEEQRHAIFERIPMQRLGSIAEVANVVAFLASEAAAYITGQTIHVNGGMYMC